jgi:outer membrane lipoprotein-sorting protein
MRNADASIASRARLGAVLLATLALATAAASAEPITWSDVAASYAAVRDYTATYEKRERAIDRGEPQTIRLSFRKPLDVRLDWLDDKGRVDQTAVYRQGMNDGKLVARRSGMLGSMVGTVRLDPHDKRALEDSRHPITEVGLGYIIDRLARDLRDGRVTSRPVVEDTVDGRPAWRFQLDAPPGVPLFGIAGAARAIVWVDRALTLPVKVEILDAAGAMIERHHFKNLRVNVGLTDAVFTL